tara:strand:+ start:223 stop:1125 length:903 start_codon:yes stop_codon:yes gene_type:complete
MATNHYFNHYGENTPDQRLIESLIIESIKVYGIDVHYMPRTLINEDSLYGEDRLSQFKDQRIIEMYIRNVDGFGGDGTFVSNFGLEVRDQITLTVSRRRFKELNFETDGRDVEPKAGDLIYFPLTDGLFTILDVQATNVFYQTGTLQSFDLVCELFSYSDEKIDTGIEEIDDIEEQQSFVRTFELASSPAVSGTFQVGETVTGGTSAKTGEVAKWDASIRYLYLINMTGNFTVGEILTGATSLATGTYETKQTTDEAVETLSAIEAGVEDEITSNKQIETDADSILDFTEGNPFSEGTNF